MYRFNGLENQGLNLFDLKVIFVELINIFLAVSVVKIPVRTFSVRISSKGGNDMIGQCKLSNFKKMWTWLCGFPAHDREYYMKYVIRLEEMWPNSCPLSNNSKEKNCDGCKSLWDTREGTLCSDPNSPLYKWKSTERQQPDDRSFYASQVAVLAMQVIRGKSSKVILRKKSISTVL